MLEERAVHLWLASLDIEETLVQRFERILCGEELDRSNRFWNGSERARYVVCHGVLREILGQYTGTKPEDVRFRYEPKGKPSLMETSGENGKRNMIRFSLAHSHGFALYAVALGREIGVDLEQVAPIAQADQIATRFFSQEEKATLTGIEGYEKFETFFKFWTCKEAYLKACGEGLWALHAFSLIDFSNSLTKCSGMFSVMGETEESFWSFQQFDPAPGFAAAVVVEGSSACSYLPVHDWTGAINRMSEF